ncbi:MAG TPA: APC family permease [Solirubrobacteraceae bacterium]|nr:APC family permease [Solirubrobacteraceae bacterium]
MQTEPTPHEGAALAPRSVSQWGTIGQSFAIGPIFGVGFLSGTVAVFAGFNTPLAVLLAGAGAFALAYVLAMYGRRFAGAGAVYEYLAHGTRSSVGIIGAGTYVTGLLFLGAGGGFVAEGYLLNNLLAGELSLQLGWAPWALLSLAAAIGLNWVGVRIGVRTIVFTAGLSVAPFLVIAVAVIADGGAAGNTIAVLDPGQTSLNDVFHGILFAVALFIGFETVAALGEEATAPRRTIPTAMIVSIVVCGCFFVLMTYVGAIGFGRVALQHNAWYASGNPFGELGQRYVGHALGWIVNLTIVLDLFSVCVAFTLAASRVLMALSRDRLLPAGLGRTSRRFRTPAGGLATIAAWSLVVIGWAAISHYGAARHIPNVLEAVLILSAAGSYLITLVYVVLAIGGLWLAWTDSDRRRLWWRIPVVLIAIAVPVLSFDGSLNPFPQYPDDIAVYAAAAGVGLTLVWYVALRIWRSAAVAVAARHAERVLAPADEAPGVGS